VPSSSETETGNSGVQVLLEDAGSGVDMPPKSVLFSFSRTTLTTGAAPHATHVK